MIDKIVEKIYSFFTKSKGDGKSKEFGENKGFDNGYNNQNNDYYQNNVNNANNQNNMNNVNNMNNGYYQNNPNNQNNANNMNNGYYQNNPNNQNNANNVNNMNNGYYQNNGYNQINQKYNNMQYYQGMKNNNKVDPGFSDYPFIYVKSKWFFPVVIIGVILIIIAICIRVFYIPDGDLKDFTSDFPDIIYVNETNKITATASGTGSLRNNNFYFSSTNNQVAEPEQLSGIEGKKINTNIIAKIPGTITLSAYSSLLNVKTNNISKKITVCNRLSKESLASESITLALSKSYQIDLNLGDSKVCYEGVKFSTSNKNISRVDEEGVITPVVIGDSIITISQGDVSVDLNVKIALKNVPVTSLVIDEANSIDIAKNTSYVLKYKVNDDATNKGVSFTSSDNSIATVTNRGKIYGMKTGQVTITVTSLDSGISSSIIVNIVKNKIVLLRDISFEENDIKMGINTVKELKVLFNPKDATNKNVIFKSSDEKIAYVSDTGVVTAYKSGEAVITVTSEDGNYTATAKIHVN